MSRKDEQEEGHPETAHYDPPPQLDAAIRSVPLVAAQKRPARIGYLTNYSFHIWYQIVIEILRRRGAQYGAEIIIQDAGKSAANQIRQAEQMLKQVDAIILTPAATEGLEIILKLAEDAGKPVVVEANPVAGMKTLVAICDYDAGYDLGVWVGQNVQKPDRTPLRILDVGLPWLRPCLLRSEGFVDGVRSIQADAVVAAAINGEATPSIAQTVAFDALQTTGGVDVIFAMDDETGQGAYQGYLDAGFPADAVTLAGFGLAGSHEKDWLMRREALKVSAGMFPEYVGLRCVDDVIKLFNGQPTPVRNVIPSVPLTADVLENYYPKKDGVWTPNFAAIAALPLKNGCTRI